MTKYIKNYYNILKVDRYADQKTIKESYKKLTLKYHPDVNDNKEDQKKYLSIQEAYSVLSDADKRIKYDELYDKAISNNNKRRKNGKKNHNNDTINLLKDIEDNFGIANKGANLLFGSLKSQPLLSGTKLLLGGAAAGVGVNRGRKYLKNRGKRFK
jgi:DnaJ-class molecular chaperone